MFEFSEPPFEPPVDSAELSPEERDAWAAADQDGEYGDGSAVLPDAGLQQVAGEALDQFEEAVEADRLDGLGADGVLAEAARSRQAERRTQARLLWLAARWADLHAVVLRPERTGRGCERLIVLGGDGTPEVAEFAPAELGAVLATTDHAAAGLVADGLDLRHRFPLLWASVQAGLVDVWLARRIVQDARRLSKEAATAVDAKIAGIAGTISWRRLKDILAAAILVADPAKAVPQAERAAGEAKAEVLPEVDHGYATMLIKAAAGDVDAFDKALGVIARALRTFGDTRPLDQRRATAVGIIANPQTAEELITRAEAARKARSSAAAGAAESGASSSGPASGSPSATASSSAASTSASASAWSSGLRGPCSRSRPRCCTTT